MSTCDCNKIENDEQAQVKLEVLKRTNRRRQAWVSLVMMIILTFLLLFVVPVDRLKILSDIAPLIYISFASIVGFYHGTSAYMSRN